LKRLALILAVGGPLFAAGAQDAIATSPSTGRRPSPIPPPDIQRGERVGVTVSCGAVQLKFDAETESAGHIGETVIVRNPETGRRFVARVEQKGQVTVKK